MRELENYLEKLIKRRAELKKQKRIENNTMDDIAYDSAIYEVGLIIKEIKQILRLS